MSLAKGTLAVLILVGSIWDSQQQTVNVGFSILYGNNTVTNNDQVNTFPGNTGIGTTLSRNSQTLEAAAQAAALYINTNQTFFTRLYQLNLVNPAEINAGASNTVYDALEDICDHIASGQISALIISRDKCLASEDIAGVASHASNPILSLDVESFSGGSRAFSMYPSAEDLNQFFIDVLEYFHWRNFLLLYDDNNAFTNLDGVVNHISKSDKNMTLVKLSGNMENHMESIMSKDTRNIFIFCSDETFLQKTLAQSLELELLGPNYTWIVGNLNAIQLNDPAVVSQLDKSNAYITHFQMNFTRETQYYLPRADDYQEWNLKSKLAYDAVIAFSHGMSLYRQSRDPTGRLGNILPGDTTMPACPTAGNIAIQNPLSTFMTKIGFEGVTGNVAFNEEGKRVNYTISIYSGQGETLEQLRGEWTQNITYWESKWNTKWRSPGRLNVSAYNSGAERKIRVVSIAVEPFLKRRTTNFQGNARFEGFIRELLDRIKSQIRGIDFDYEVELVPDNHYGSRDIFSDIWNGMIGEVVRRKADIAAGPLTVTSEREEVVDFSFPFMSSGIKVLVKNPYFVRHYPFRIMYPLSVDVWVVNLFCFFITALMLWVYNKYDPFEWGQVAERGETFEENADNFSFQNSLWWCATTMFLQNYDNSPRSTAGRCLASFWWLFVVVMVFLYLFNLTFFVTTNKRLVYVKNAEDLLEQVEVEFGTIEFGSTYHFFWRSAVPEYQRVFQRMITTRPNVFVHNITEAIERVRASNGHYAFIGEAGEISYLASKPPCDLLVTGGFISRTSYAFAVQKGSPLKEQLSHAIETLRDTGVLEDLEKDFWEPPLQEERCRNLTVWEKQGVFSFTINDLQGVYYILLLGCFSAVIVFAIEFVWYGVSGGSNKKKPRSSGGGGGGGGVQRGGGAGGGGGAQGVTLSGGGGGGGDKGNMWL